MLDKKCAFCYNEEVKIRIRKGRVVRLTHNRLKPFKLKKDKKEKAGKETKVQYKPSSILEKAALFRKDDKKPDLETSELQKFDFDPIEQTVAASDVEEIVEIEDEPETNSDIETLSETTPEEEAVERSLEVEVINDSTDELPLNTTITREPRTLKVGPTSEYDYFDDIVHLLVKGDTVQFEEGSHIILASKINVSDITFLGSNATDTLVDIVPTEDGPLFYLEKNSTLQLRSLTVRVAPKSRLAFYDNHARISMDSANLHWNHYKIQKHEDNIPLIAPQSPNVILDKFKAFDTYSHTIDIFARSMEVANSSIGDDDGKYGILSGWSEQWNNATLHNMSLATGGTINELTILGKVIVEDIPARFTEAFPALKYAPLVIDDLKFGRVVASSPDKAILAKGSVVDKASRFVRVVTGDDASKAIKLKKHHDKSKSLSNKEILMRDYEFTNIKDLAPVYINFSAYNVTTDRRPIYNGGKLVLSGSTGKSKSPWACVQAKGQLRFNDLSTEWIWAFESEDAAELSRFDAINSRWSDGAKKMPALEPTTRQPTGEVPLRPEGLELESVKAKYLKEVRPWEDDVVNLELNPKNISILVHSGIEMSYITAVLRRKETPVTVLSSSTIRSSRPSDKTQILASRIHNIWVIDNLKTLIDNPDWNSQLLNLVYRNELPTRILFLTDDINLANSYKAKVSKYLTVDITSVSQD